MCMDGTTISCSLLPFIYLDLHIIFSLICCTVHGVPHQVTLGAIPLDMLCEIWEVFDHVEHLTCERVSDPQQVCLAQFRMLSVVDISMFTCISESKATLIILFHHYTECPCLKHVCICISLFMLHRPYLFIVGSKP